MGFVVEYTSDRVTWLEKCDRWSTVPNRKVQKYEGDFASIWLAQLKLTAPQSHQRVVQIPP